MRLPAALPRLAATALLALASGCDSGGDNCCAIQPSYSIKVVEADPAGPGGKLDVAGAVVQIVDTSSSFVALEDTSEMNVSILHHGGGPYVVRVTPPRGYRLAPGQRPASLARAPASDQTITVWLQRSE